MQKASQYDFVVREATKLAEEVGALKEKNLQIMNKFAKKPNYNSYSSFNMDHDYFGGDPMAQ